jgi:hypothetical protein
MKKTSFSFRYSLVRPVDSFFNNNTVIVPGSSFSDAATGAVLVVGVSASFLIENASLITGEAAPRLGVDLPVSTIQSLPNLPGRFIGGGYILTGATGPRVNPRPGRKLLLHPPESQCSAVRDCSWWRRMLGACTAEPDAGQSGPQRRQLSASDLASRAAFVESFLDFLPPQISKNATEWLSQYGFTLASPQLPFTIPGSIFVNLNDLEISGASPILLASLRRMRRHERLTSRRPVLQFAHWRSPTRWQQ